MAASVTDARRDIALKSWLSIFSKERWLDSLEYYYSCALDQRVS